MGIRKSYIKPTEMSEANLVQWRVAVVGLAAWMLLENWVDTRNWGVEFMMRISNVNPEAKGKEECFFSAASPFSTRRVPQQLAQKLDMLLIAWAHFTTRFSVEQTIISSVLTFSCFFLSLFNFPHHSHLLSLPPLLSILKPPWTSKHSLSLISPEGCVSH